MSPPFSRSKNTPKKKPARSRQQAVQRYTAPPPSLKTWKLLWFCYRFVTTKQWLSVFCCIVLIAVLGVTATHTGVPCEVRTGCLKLTYPPASRWFPARLILDSEYGGSTFLRYFGLHSTVSQKMSTFVTIAVRTKKKPKQTPWSESASELYRPSDRRLPAKLVPTFAYRGVPRSQRGVSPTAVISVF
jgi:hypothetical protein